MDTEEGGTMFTGETRGNNVAMVDGNKVDRKDQDRINMSTRRCGIHKCEH